MGDSGEAKRLRARAMTVTLGSRPPVTIQSFSPAEGRDIEVRRGDHYGAKGFIFENQIEPSVLQVVSQFGIAGALISGGIEGLERRAAETIFNKIRSNKDLPEFVQVTIEAAPTTVEEELRRVFKPVKLNFEFVALKQTSGTKMIDKILAIILVIVIAVSVNVILNQIIVFLYGPSTKLKVIDPKTGLVIIEFEGPARFAPTEAEITPEGGVKFRPVAPGDISLPGLPGIEDVSGLIILVLVVAAAIVLVITFARRPS